MSLNKNLSTFAQYVSANGESVNINSDSLVITANAYYFANGDIVGSQVSIPPNLVTNGYIQDEFSPTVTLHEDGFEEFQFTGSTANSYEVATTTNTTIQVFQNGIKLSNGLFSVPNTTHVNLVDSPDSNDVIQFVINKANVFTLSYSSTDINRLGLASNTYIQNQVLSNFITVTDASFKEYQFTSTTANSFSVPTQSDSTVQVWKSGIKLSNTLFSVPNTTHVNLVDTPQTNDTISIQAYNPNSYNLVISSNTVIYEAFISNNYYQDVILNNPITVRNAAYTQSEFSNTTQTLFNFDSTSNSQVEVFINGIKLSNDLFTVYSPNNSVVLGSAPQSNDVISITGFNPNSYTYTTTGNTLLYNTIQSELNNTNITFRNASFTQSEFSNTTANSFAFATTSNTTVEVFFNGIKLSDDLFQVPNTTHVSVVDTPTTNDVIFITAFNPNSYTFSVSANSVVGSKFVSNNYLSPAIKISSSNVGIGVSSPTAKLDIDDGGGIGPTVIIKGGGTATDLPADNEQTLYLKTRDGTVGLSTGIGFWGTFETGGDTNARRAADMRAGFNNGSGAWGNEYMTFNVGINDGANTNDSASMTTERLRITKKTLIANVVALGTVTTGTGNTTWDVTKHQMAIITTSHGNTDITIAYANDAATGLGSTLLVNDTGKSSNLNITMAGASPPGIKYPSATAPTINSTNGETLVVSFINTGSGQLVASSVTTANTT